MNGSQEGKLVPQAWSHYKDRTKASTEPWERALSQTQEVTEPQSHK